MDQKSVLIIGLGRSCSNKLSEVCSAITGMANIGEFTRFLEDVPWFAPCRSEQLYWDKILNQLESYSSNSVVKDSCQLIALCSHMHHLVKQFNVIYIHRPLHEVTYCHERRGWETAHLKHCYAALRACLYCGVETIEYEQFIYDDSIIHEILERWYAVTPFPYIDDVFIQRRESSMRGELVGS